MYLIETKNRAKTRKNLNQPPKLYPFLGMENIQRSGRARPSPLGCSFFGDDADVTGLIMSDMEPWYAGPLDAKSVAAITELLTLIETRMTEQKKFYAQFLADLLPDIQSLDSTIERYKNMRMTKYTFGYWEHINWLGEQLAKFQKCPPIARDVVCKGEGNRIGRMIAGKIVKP